MSGQKTTYSITDTVKVGKENNVARVKNEKLDINRTMYKDIKKYDREQMNNFLQDIYETGLKNGHEKGLQEASKGLSKEKLKIKGTLILHDISKIKGIGPAKLAEIDSVLQTRLKELMKNEPE